MLGSTTNQNARETVRGYCYAYDREAATVVIRIDSRASKTLNQSRATNDNSRLRVHVDPIFNHGREGWRATLTGRLFVRPARHGEAVQLQRDVRRFDRDAGSIRDGAGDVVYQLAVLGDGQSSGDRPANISG